MLPRDIFINEVKKKMEKDKDIYFLSADFGAAALDEIRFKFKKNFIHCGISEQAMLDIATGLALKGKKVFVYAMAPFISLRCLEQIKCGPGLMSLPICIISVGIGLGYADSGPTHYANEDFSCLRSVLGINIYTIADNFTAKTIGKKLASKAEFSYVRLDRNFSNDLNKNTNQIKNGFRVFGKFSKKSKIIVTHGYLTHMCNKIVKKNIFLIELIHSKPISKKLIKFFSNNSKVYVFDEQNINGNLSSALFEFLSEKKIFPKINNFSLPEKYIYENGGRSYLLDKYGFSERKILKALSK